MKGVGSALKNLDRWYERKLAGIYAIAQHYASEGEATAKRDAKWQDRTAHARQRIRGKAFRNDTFIGFQIIHGVGYGVYLEKAYEGRYAVLKPTADKLAPQFVADVKSVMGFK